HSTWTPQRTTGCASAMLAVLQHLHAVDEHVANADRVGVGMLERPPVRNRRWIEDNASANLPALRMPRRASPGGPSSASSTSHRVLDELRPRVDAPRRACERM